MFPLFTVFFVFIIALNVALRRQNRSQDAIDREFWARELAANNTRRQDLGDLDYITIPSELLMHNLGTESEKALLELSSGKLVNLTGMTNTDLKLKYGIANLETLSEYEENFTRYVSLVPVYAAELLEAGHRDSARSLLSLAAEQGADSCPVYTLLARMYCEDQTPEKAKELLDRAGTLNSISGRMIAAKLQELLDAQP